MVRYDGLLNTFHNLNFGRLTHPTGVGENGRLPLQIINLSSNDKQQHQILINLLQKLVRELE